MAFGILGGWVRDQLLALNQRSRAPSPRDIDLVVVDATHEALARVLPPATSRTLFGGFTFAGKRLDIDLWGAKDTFLTNRLGLPSDLIHVLAVTDFNINAIVFLPSQASAAAGVVDGGALDAVATKTIAFHFEQIALPRAQVARLLTFSMKLGFAFDDAVVAFICEHSRDEVARTAIRDNLAEHYAEPHVIAAMTLLESVLKKDHNTI